jgi:hypothetical protein
MELSMSNRFIFTSAAAMAILGHSFACAGEDASIVNTTTPFSATSASTLTRAAVQGDAADANVAGLLPVSEAGPLESLQSSQASALTRVEVQAQAAEANADGLLAVNEGGDFGGRSSTGS